MLTHNTLMKRESDSYNWTLKSCQQHRMISGQRNIFFPYSFTRDVVLKMIWYWNDNIPGPECEWKLPPIWSTSSMKMKPTTRVMPMIECSSVMSWCSWLCSCTWSWSVPVPTSLPATAAPSTAFSATFTDASSSPWWWWPARKSALLLFKKIN